MNTKKFTKAVLAVLLVLVLVMTTSPALAYRGAEAPLAATYYVQAAWVKTNLLAQHQSYGVFIARSGHTNLRMYYMTGTNTGYLLGNTTCGAINTVTGPGYINDPSGTNSAYVPSGWMGMGICASTSTLWYLKYVKGYNINDTSRWRLYYER